MIKEITKTTVEQVKVCDICESSDGVTSTCAICGKDICSVCSVSSFSINSYGVNIIFWLCPVCGEKPAKEIWSLLTRNDGWFQVNIPSVWIYPITNNNNTYYYYDVGRTTAAANTLMF